MAYTKGGLRAAFLFFPFSIVVLTWGVPFSYALGGLRAAAFAAAAVWLWRRRNGPVSGSACSVAVAAFAVMSVGHAFSSVYVWVSLQHALNIGMTAVLLYWALARFRDPSAGEGSLLPAWFAAVAAIEVAVAAYQRLAGGGTRPEGTFSNPMFLSEFLAMAAMVLAGRALWDAGESRRGRWAWGGGAFLLLASALSLTSSRGVLLAAVPALGVLLALRFGLSRGLRLFLFAGLPALAVAGWHSFFRFQAMDAYHYGRWVLWKAALRVFAEHPFGVGLGGYKYFWFRAQEPFPEAFRHYARFAQTPHNEFLEVLVGLGFLGLLFFLAAIVPPMLLAARGWKEVPESRRGLAAGAFAALTLTGVQALFNFNFHEAGIFCADALLLGALLACLPERSLGRPVPLPPWLSKGTALACALLSAASLSLLAGNVFYERGVGEFRGGDMASAERELGFASAFDPLRSRVPEVLSGISYRRFLVAARDGDEDAMRNLDDSIRRQLRARELCPMEQEYSHRLGILYRDRFLRTGRAGDLEASLNGWEEALRVNPYRVETLWEKAMTLEGIGRTGDAGAALLHAVSIEPNFCRAYAKLAGLSKGADAAQSFRWEARAETCREAARGRMLEGNELWLVGENGSAPGKE